MQARKIYLDTVSRSLVASPDSTVGIPEPVFFSEDVERVELYFLAPTNSFSTPYTYVDYSANSVKLAVGITAPAALQTSWSPVSTTVTITSSVSITGGSGVTEVQRVFISKTPASGVYSLRLAARNVTISSLASNTFTAPFHGLLDNQSITLTGFSSPSGFSNGSVYWVRDRTRDTFKISATAGASALTISASSGGTAAVPAFTTAPISAGATPGDVALAINSALGTTTQQIVTTGSGEDYLITYSGALAGTAMPLIEAVNSTLLAAPGIAGTVNFNTDEMLALVLAGTNEAVLEIEVAGGGMRHTYQTTARLGFDVITASTGSEGTPVVEAAATSFNLQSPNGTVYSVSATDVGALQTVVNTVATSAPTGFTLISPNLSKYQITVDNDGILFATDIST